MNKWEEYETEKKLIVAKDAKDYESQINALIKKLKIWRFEDKTKREGVREDDRQLKRMEAEWWTGSRYLEIYQGKVVK